MERFSYASRENVLSLIKGKTPKSREDMIDEQLWIASSRLSAWYPTLRSRWENADPSDPIVDFVVGIVAETVRKRVMNPDGMASETMGPYAYSRYDSEDSSKTSFNARDLKALERLLTDGVRRAPKSIRTSYANAFPAAPITRRGRATNSNRWKRGR